MARGSSYAGVPPGPLSAYLGVREANRSGDERVMGFLAKLQEAQEARRMAEEFRRDQLSQRAELFREGNESRNALSQQLLQARGQQQLDLEKQRAADREAQLRLAATLRPPLQEPAPVVQTDEQGNTKLYDRKGNLIKDLGKTGKPNAEVLKEQMAQAKMKRDLALIEPTLQEISKEGGLLDQATGSGAGALVDIAAGFVGYGTPGAIAIGKLKPATDAVLKLVPRFEGPQSDKDTKMYQDAAGNLANPSTPNSVKKEAARTILQIYKQRKNQFVTRDYEAMVGVSGPQVPEAPDPLGIR